MHAPVQEVETAQTIALVTAIAVVAFWRTVVRSLIVVASTAIIATFDLASYAPYGRVTCRLPIGPRRTWSRPIGRSHGSASSPRKRSPRIALRLA